MQKIKKPFFKYAMKLRHRQTGEIRYVVKCRGCWERVDSPLDFNQFKVTFCSCFVYTLFFTDYGQCVRHWGEAIGAVGKNTFTARLEEWTSHNAKPKKVIFCISSHMYYPSCFRRYSTIYDKGFVDANLHCYPFGYRGLPLMNPLWFTIIHIFFLRIKCSDHKMFKIYGW
jgi:hypothetical protein